MKDLEKIKSEDLGCQVQDANPGNFAIEQEVAQLVGATVPAPTEPSADDARELGAQLLVFLRRALLPIQTALRTAVAAIYAHLDSRCTDYTPAGYDPFRLPAGPYDPMRPFVPRTLPNLLTALTAFSARKITGVPEAADGISLVNISCSSAYTDITEITDSTRGWTMSRSLSLLRSLFPNATKYELGCSEVPHINVIDCGNKSIPIIRFGEDCYINAGTSQHYISMILNNAAEEITLRFKKAIWYCGDECGFLKGCSNVKKLTIEDCEYLDIERLFYQPTPALEELRIPSLRYWYNTRNRLWYAMSDLTKLRIVEVGHMETSFNLSIWKPDSTILDGGDNQALFLQNFKTYIALRLTANGSGLTLTLSQAVRDAIHAAEATYGIEAIIVTQKGWTLSPAPTA